MQRLEVSCALRRIYMSLGAKGVIYSLAHHIYKAFEVGSVPHKHIRNLFGFFLKFWILYRSDDGLADRMKVVTQEKCNCVVQECIFNIFTK